QNYQNDINATSNWLASSSVTLKDGAVRSSANALAINPYFSNLGVHGFVKNSSYYANVKNYMEWYWNHVGFPRNFNVDGCTVQSGDNTPGDLFGAINDFDVSNASSSTPTEMSMADPDSSGNHH